MFFRLPIFVLLILSFVFACSTPSWLPIKTGLTQKAPPHKAKMKELLNKEVVIIDRQEYVKIPNPMASEGGKQSKYLYVPVDEYLKKKDAYSTPTTITPKEEAKSVRAGTVGIDSYRAVVPTLDSKSGSPPSPQIPISLPAIREKDKEAASTLRKKVLIVPFDDRMPQDEETVGDWMAEKLVKEINRSSKQILFIDYQMVKAFLEEKGIPFADLETPKVLHLLNEVFGVHALIVGQLSGPYTFITKEGKGQYETASAIVKAEMRILDTLTGKTLKNLSANNPILATKEKGDFSEEKAKIHAIDLTVADLSRSLSREIDGLDWFCRVAKVDGEEVYINAGSLTGIKAGDVMEVFQPGDRQEVKGRILISACFGIDASIGRLVYGKKPGVNDILKMAKREAT